MFIAPMTLPGDIPLHPDPDDHRRRDYNYTLRHTDAESAEPIPLIHWLMAQKDIYEKCLATLNKKKRPGLQKQRAPTKRPTHTRSATEMLTKWLQQQQQMTQIMLGQLAPQAATGLMDANWTPSAPLAIEAPAVRGPTDLRNFLQVNHAAQTPHQAPQTQHTSQPPIRTQGRGRGRNPNRNARGRPNNRHIPESQSSRRRNRHDNTPEPGQGNRPEQRRI